MSKLILTKCSVLMSREFIILLPTEKQNSHRAVSDVHKSLNALISCFTGKCELKRFDKWVWGIFVHLKSTFLLSLTCADTNMYILSLKTNRNIQRRSLDFFTLYCLDFKHVHLNHPVCLFHPPEQWASTSGLTDFQREASFSFTAGKKHSNTHKPSSGDGVRM